MQCWSCHILGLPCVLSLPVNISANGQNGTANMGSIPQTSHEYPSPSPERSALMARIRSKDTSPEKTVRRLVHRMGFRYRLYRRDLPGTPDLVFPRLRKVILVHGCFWHRHVGCKLATVPKTRPGFWQAKFDSNVRRDAKATDELQAQGWEILTVWECETRKRNQDELQEKLRNFLESDSRV